MKIKYVCERCDQVYDTHADAEKCESDCARETAIREALQGLDLKIEDTFLPNNLRQARSELFALPRPLLLDVANAFRLAEAACSMSGVMPKSVPGLGNGLPVTRLGGY